MDAQVLPHFITNKPWYIAIPEFSLAYRPGYMAYMNSFTMNHKYGRCTRLREHTGSIKELFHSHALAGYEIILAISALCTAIYHLIFNTAMGKSLNSTRFDADCEITPPGTFCLLQRHIHISSYVDI